MNALEVLESHQQQIDETDEMVGVSRQALEELIADYKQRSKEISELEKIFAEDASGFIQFLVKNGIQVNVGAGVELSVSGDTGNIVDISCKKLQQEPQE